MLRVAGAEGEAARLDGCGVGRVEGSELGVVLGGVASRGGVGRGGVKAHQRL